MLEILIPVFSTYFNKKKKGEKEMKGNTAIAEITEEKLEKLNFFFLIFQREIISKLNLSS